MQPPPPCRSACSLQKEDAGGSPGATSLNPLIWEQIPFEVALPCLLVFHNPLDEAFAEMAVRMLHREIVALPIEAEAVRWCCHPPGRQLQPFRAKFPLHSPRGCFSFHSSLSPSLWLPLQRHPSPSTKPCGPGVRPGLHKPIPLMPCGSQLLLGHRGERRRRCSFVHCLLVKGRRPEHLLPWTGQNIFSWMGL